MERKTVTPLFAPDASESLAALETMLPAAWMDAAWFESLSQIGREYITFIAERVKEDVKAQQALMQCKTLTEMQSVQADFIQTAFAQYQAETGKLVAMGGEMVTKMAKRSKT